MKTIILIVFECANKLVETHREHAEYEHIALVGYECRSPVMQIFFACHSSRNAANILTNQNLMQNTPIAAFIQTSIKMAVLVNVGLFVFCIFYSQTKKKFTQP